MSGPRGNGDQLDFVSLWILDHSSPPPLAVVRRFNDDCTNLDQVVDAWFNCIHTKSQTYRGRWSLAVTQRIDLNQWSTLTCNTRQVSSTSTMLVEFKGEPDGLIEKARGIQVLHSDHY